MYKCIIQLFGKEDYRAKGKKAKERENRRRKKRAGKIKVKNQGKKKEELKRPNGMQMPTMWTNLGSYYYYS